MIGALEWVSNLKMLYTREVAAFHDTNLIAGL